MSKLIKLKETITSLELVDKINELRREENNKEIMRHNNLVVMIKREFSEEEGMLYVKQTPYIHPQNKNEYVYYELDFYQTIQILMRESLKVRQGIIKYIKKLEQENLMLKQALWNRQNSEWLKTREQGKLTRRNETDVISSLIVYAENQGSKNYNKLYTVYSKLVNSLVGIKSNMRDIIDTRTLEHIRLLEDLFSKLIVNSMEQEIYYKEIYQICKRKGTELMNLLEIDCKQLDNKEVDLIEYTE